MYTEGDECPMTKGACSEDSPGNKRFRNPNNDNRPQSPRATETNPQRIISRAGKEAGKEAEAQFCERGKRYV
jgi:hypothetical protein